MGEPEDEEELKTVEKGLSVCAFLEFFTGAWKMMSKRRSSVFVHFRKMFQCLLCKTKYCTIWYLLKAYDTICGILGSLFCFRSFSFVTLESITYDACN